MLQGERCTLRVLSLDPETNMRESLDQAIWYTGPTWPRNVAANVPFTPSHSLMLLSNDALTSQRPSGENCTCDTASPNTPVNHLIYAFFLDAAVYGEKGSATHCAAVRNCMQRVPWSVGNCGVTM